MDSEVINMNFKGKVPNNNKYNKEETLIAADCENAGCLFPVANLFQRAENIVHK